MLVELFGSILPGMLYLALLIPPSRHRDRPTARLVVAWVGSAVVLETVLALAVLGVPMPTWVGAVTLAGPLAVSWWRLGLLLKKRRV